MLKRLFKNWLANILWWQVHRLQKKNDYRVVAVTGSIGKTSTKRAIAQYLNQNCSVQYQQGNYNDLVSVPLIYFGLSLPALYNPFAWLGTLYKIEQQLRRPYPFDVVVLELGTDEPGHVAAFSRYVKPDVAVVTAVTPEHMEAFGSLDEVAREELSVANFSRQVILNADDIPIHYRQDIVDYAAYGSTADPRIAVNIVATAPNKVKLQHGTQSFTVQTDLVGLHVQKALAAAYLTGVLLEVPCKQPGEALKAVTSMPGRMQLLRGSQQGTIIDDTYNASPEAVIAALDVLYDISASHKVAVIGNMNEMGGYAKKAHQSVARYLDPEKLDEIITIGQEAELFLAPVARELGNTVHVFTSPYEIGNYLQDNLQPDTAVLFKGSQNGVFLEEAIKPILQDAADEKRLVRQTPHWLKKKSEQFPGETN